jgi:hypothetical protein
MKKMVLIDAGELERLKSHRNPVSVTTNSHDTLTRPDSATPTHAMTPNPQRMSEYRPHEYRPPNPTMVNLGSLDMEMRQVLDSDNLSEGEKIKQYSYLLDNFLKYYSLAKSTPSQRLLPPRMKSERENRISLNRRLLHEQGDGQGGETEEEEEEEEYLTTKGHRKQLPAVISTALKNIPSSMKGRAMAIINSIQTSNVLSWDENGHIIYRNKKVKGSNLADLINDALRPRKQERPPGWKEFAKGLTRINIPREIARNPSYWDAQVSSSSSSSSSSPLKIRGVETLSPYVSAHDDADDESDETESDGFHLPTPPGIKKKKTFKTPSHGTPRGRNRHHESFITESPWKTSTGRGRLLAHALGTKQKTWYSSPHM